MATGRKGMGLGSGVLRCVFTAAGRTDWGAGGKGRLGGGKGRIGGISAGVTALVQVGDDGG